jgi:S1-C subfamily serine protease
MITANVLQRIFHIEVGNSTGTCFTIDVDNKQYIVTAKHLVENISAQSTVDMFYDEQWKKIDITLIGHGQNDIDISVLSTDFQLSPTLPLPPTSAGIIYGQDVYFLGFPYGMFSQPGDIMRNFPMPFVKKAILSNISAINNVQIFSLDGQNNPGFSGGPVVFKSLDSNDYKVAAVISGYRYTNEPIFNGAKELPLVYRHNTGIIFAYGIKHATDLINVNPAGFALIR